MTLALSMVFVLTMATKQHSNDNEELPFKSIGLASMLILNKLRLATQLEEKERHASDDRSNTDSNETDRDDLHRETKKPANRIGNRS